MPAKQKRVESIYPVSRGKLFLEQLEDRTAPATSALDVAFGVAGASHVQLEGFDLEMRDLVIQEDNKIVGAGRITDEQGNQDFFVSRFHSNGWLDQSFGEGGFSIIDFGEDEEGASALTLDEQGNIVVVGNSGFQFAIARINADGIEDQSFGTRGKVITAISGARDVAHGVVVQSDKIIVAGYSNNSVTTSEIAVLRLNNDGLPDGTFDQDGIVTKSFPGYRAVGLDVILDEEGNIIVSSNRNRVSPRGDFHFVLVKFDTDGQPVDAFGNEGIAVSAFPNSRGEVWDAVLAVQSDGSLLVGGGSDQFTSFPRYAVTRFDPTGEIDRLFGTDGITILPFTGAVHDIAVLPDNSFFVTGDNIPEINVPNAYVSYFDKDGTPDDAFGDNGHVAIPFNGQALLHQPDGRIVVGGFTNQTSKDIAMMRFEGTAESSNVLLHDNFNDNSLDTSLWSTNTDIVRGPARVEEQNGQILLSNRGHLNTKSEIQAFCTKSD